MAACESRENGTRSLSWRPRRSRRLLVLTGCGARAPSVHPSAGAPSTPSSVAAGTKPLEEATAANTTPRPVPASMITHGTRAAEFARQPVPPGAPECTKEQRQALTFEHAPTYTEQVERDGSFSARLFIGNPAACTRKVDLPLSFTPPKTTRTRTVDFAAYVPPRGAFVELTLSPSELAESEVTPGRYAITFAVLDEEGKEVGRALSGNPFRLGRDDVSITKAPAIPARIGVADEPRGPALDRERRRYGEPRHAAHRVHAAGRDGRDRALRPAPARRPRRLDLHAAPVATGARGRAHRSRLVARHGHDVRRRG